MDDLLSGQAAYVFWMSVLDAALLSWIAMRWYRRSMRALMDAPASRDAAGVAAEAGPSAVSATAGAAASSSPSLALFEPEPGRRRLMPGGGPAPARRRLALAYGLGAAVFAGVITWADLASESVSVVAWVEREWANAWPIVPTLIVLLALDRRDALRVIAGYLGFGALLALLLTVGIQLARGTLNAQPIVNVYWFLVGIAVTASSAAVLVLLSVRRRLRAMMPLALAATLCFGLGLALFRNAVIQGFDVAAVRDVVLGLSVRTSAHVTYYGLFFVAALPIGFLAWLGLRGIAAGYRRKAFSDAQLVVDCMWVIVAADQMTTALVSSHRVRDALAVVAALGAYRVVVELVLRRGPAAREGSRRLLLLRVFGYQGRTEALFDRVAQQWRFHGPVQLIAGIDLITRSVDPGDVLSFIGGRLADQVRGHRSGPAGPGRRSRYRR